MRRGAVVALAALLASASPGEPAGSAGTGILLFVADDWSAEHAGTYGEPHVRTPVLDRLARSGVVFEQAFAAAPVCAPSRAALLTGRAIGALGAAANQGGAFPDTVATYVEALAAAGWAAGFAGKGWAPGPPAERNPAGDRYASLEEFLSSRPPDVPFHFWHGTVRPHRPFERGSGVRAGGRLGDAPLPWFLPDAPEIREDLLDYLASVEAMDRELGGLLRDLDRRGRAEGTLVCVSGDNGMPFPRAKGNVYDSGARVPLVAAAAAARGIVRDPVALTDLAPTFLEWAGAGLLPGMIGRSLAPEWRSDAAARPTGQAQPPRDGVVIARERHENARSGARGYPVRALRTRDFLYIRNLRPDRPAAGDPRSPDGSAAFADVDPSPTKVWMLDRLPATDARFVAAFGARPAEELYALAADPGQQRDVARESAFAAVRDSLRARLVLAAGNDPRAADIADPLARDGGEDPFDALPDGRARRRGREGP